VALEARLPGLKLAKVSLGPALSAEGRYGRLPASFAGEPALEKESLSLRLSAARLGSLEVSPAFMAALASFEEPLGPTAAKPYRLKLAGLTVSQGLLSIP
jgi:hypothetical protein